MPADSGRQIFEGARFILSLIALGRVHVRICWHSLVFAAGFSSAAPERGQKVLLKQVWDASHSRGDLSERDVEMLTHSC